MNGSIIAIPCLSVRARRICLFNRLENYNRRKRRPNPLINQSKEEKDKRNSLITKKRIYDAVHILRDTATPKTVFNRKYNSRFICFLTFVTLTLPARQTHTDGEIHYGLFAPFMRILKKKYPGLLYIWRAETQENRNLHYHLITNQFMHWRDLRNLWNNQCYRFGYRLHDNPNSTDIHSLKNVRDEAAYIAKYITKEEEGRRQVEIRKWDYCSALKRVKPVTIEMPSNALYNELRELIKRGGRKKIYDYVTVISFLRSHVSALPNLESLLTNFFSQLNVNAPPAEFVVN